MKHKIKYIHFVGIGGVGMCGIAEVLLTLGYTVSGSDIAESASTKRLRALGVQVFIGHDADNLGDANVIVISSALDPGNPEILSARQRQIPIVPRAQMLAELMRLKQGVAIAGTHGKTTTTSLVASCLAEGGLDPTFVIGGKLVAAQTNARLGTGDFLVAEADESDASFLLLSPVVSVVTNIDADHMDTYGHDLAKLKQAFIDFLNRLPFYGVAVLCIDDPNVRQILPFVSRQVITYGLDPSAQLRAENLVPDGTRMRFDVVRKASPEVRMSVELSIPGEHNVRNALAAIAVADEVGVPSVAVLRALAEFKGVGRRFQSHGDVVLARGGSFTLIEDYGHHPAEIAATLGAARNAFPGRRLVVAFQPHRYTRTRDCFEDFVRVLNLADVLVLSEVYSAGEAQIVAADSRALARAIRVAGKLEPIFVEDVLEMPRHILQAAENGDVVIAMGAGSIGLVPKRLLLESALPCAESVAWSIEMSQSSLSAFGDVGSPIDYGTTPCKSQS